MTPIQLSVMNRSYLSLQKIFSLNIYHNVHVLDLLSIDCHCNKKNTSQPESVSLLGLCLQSFVHDFGFLHLTGYAQMKYLRACPSAESHPFEMVDDDVKTADCDLIFELFDLHRSTVLQNGE